MHLQELLDKAAQLQAALAASRVQATSAACSPTAADPAADCPPRQQPQPPVPVHAASSQTVARRVPRALPAKRRPIQPPSGESAAHLDLLHELLAVSPSAVPPSTAGAQKLGAAAPTAEGASLAEPQPGPSSGANSSGSATSSGGSGATHGSGSSSVHDSASSGRVPRASSGGGSAARRFAEDVLLREVVSQLKGTPDTIAVTAFPVTRLRRPSDGPFAALPVGKPDGKPRSVAAVDCKPAAAPAAAAAWATGHRLFHPAAAEAAQQVASGVSSLHCTVQSVTVDSAAATAVAAAAAAAARHGTAGSAAGSLGSFTCRVRLPDASSGDLPCSRLAAGSAALASGSSEGAAAAAGLQLSGGSCVLPVMASQRTYTAVVELWQHVNGSHSSADYCISSPVSSGGPGSTAGVLLGLAAVPLAAHPAAPAASATGPPAALADGCFQLRDVLTGRRVGSVHVVVTAVDAAAAPSVAAAAAAPAAAQPAAAVATAGSSATDCQQCGMAAGDACNDAAPATRSSAGGDCGHGGKQSSGRASKPEAGSSRPEASLPDAAAPDASGLPPSDSILIRVHRAHGLQPAAEGGPPCFVSMLCSFQTIYLCSRA